MADAEIPAVRELDRLRRLAERWTDILLGPLACGFALRNLVFDPARSREYGQSMLPYLCTPAGSSLFAAGLTAAFPETVLGVPLHAGLHQDMAAAVLRLFPREVFESDGSLRPVRTVRIGRDSRPRDARPEQPGPSRPSVQVPPIHLSFSDLRRRLQNP